MHKLIRLNKLFWLVNAGLAVVLIFVVSSLSDAGKPVTDDPGRFLQKFAGNRSGAADGGVLGHGDPCLILERNIFGVNQRDQRRAPAAMTRKVSKPKTVVRKPVPFRLIGTVASEEGNSYAILENLDTQTQDIYRVGDSMGDVRLDRIEQNRVVVLNRGTPEVLDLTVGSRELAPRAVVAKANEPVKQGGSGNLVREVANGHREINRRASSSKLNRAACALFEKMELSPHVVQGKSRGLKISGLGDSMVAKVAGLKDGDVLHSVNGHSVSNQRKALQVFKKARKLRSARLELSRGQETKSLAFRAGTW